MMSKRYDNEDDHEENHTSIWVKAGTSAFSGTTTTPTKSERTEQQQQQDEAQSSPRTANDAVAKTNPREPTEQTQTTTTAFFDVDTTATASRVQSALNPKDAPLEDMMSTNHRLPFPLKLHMLLDEAQRLRYHDIVSWDANGTSFRVHKPIEFFESILVRYFRQSKYESFTRQCE
jgi:hypothetical protein